MIERVANVAKLLSGLSAQRNEANDPLATMRVPNALLSLVERKRTRYSHQLTSSKRTKAETVAVPQDRSKDSRSKAAHLLRRCIEECSKPSADPLRIARELHRCCEVPQVALELAKILLAEDVLLERMSHLEQTSLLLLLRLQRDSFFPGEWSQITKILSSKSKEDGWSRTFRELCLNSLGAEVRPFPTPKWLLDFNKSPVRDRAKECSISNRNLTGQSQEDDAETRAPRDVQEELHELLSMFQQEKTVESALLKLRTLLLELSRCHGNAVPDLHFNDEVLSSVVGTILEGDASLADVTLSFRFLLASQASVLSKSPSQTLISVMTNAASAHPRTFCDVVLKSVVRQTSMNLAQVELLRKVVCVRELSRFIPDLLLEFAVLSDWNENSLVVMQTIIQYCLNLQAKVVESLSLQLRNRRKTFSQSLHYAKLIHTIVQRFPREAYDHKEHFLQALECNKTFFSKSASSKLALLEKKYAL